MSQTTEAPVTREEFHAAMKQIENLIRTQRSPSPIMTRAEAKALSTRSDDDAFDLWRKHWGVTPVSHGRYSRTQIELALKREAGELPTPATLRRKWEGATT